MPQVILSRVQIINGIALHPGESIEVTDSVRDELQRRGALVETSAITSDAVETANEQPESVEHAG